ncbi:unnamed protein product [Aureobasidium vineae]|uniref:Uncharacterized protein n=1 Tax=Aureobasidium vineae TaxID=2773715 RepID=A0A9N8J7A1_9PEZI|nr:unnamed protein product [Aureobasidium vineae]
MPPKKDKKDDKDGKKRVTRAGSAKAAKEKADAADGAAVKDGGKKTAAKPAKPTTPTKPTTPAKKATPVTGAKRKRADEEDEEDDSPPRTRNPKKPKLSPKTARRVKLESYLEDRIKDLGFKVEPSKHHESDDEDEDEPDEEWASMQRLRQRCDDRLDDIEEAIRTIGRGHEFYSNLDIPERKSDETRHEKRQKDKEIQDDQEINPIAEKKRVKISKNFPDGRKYRSAKQLGDLVKQLERQLGDELKNRKVQHTHDVSLAKYPSKRVRKAKEAAKARGESPKLTRTLDKQWDKHGLTLRELLDLYNRQGEQTPAPVRDDLVKKCQKYGLSTLANKQRMYGLSQEAINKVISALSDIKAPVDSDEDDDGGDDSDDAAGPYADINTGGKGKDQSKDGKKDASASLKGSKKGGKGAEALPKGPGHRDPSSGLDIAAPALTRLAIGDENNTDLRVKEKHDTPEDGHVADTTEVAEEVEDDEDDEDPKDDEEEDEVDGDGGPPPPPASGAAVTAASTAAARRSSSTRSHPSRKSSAQASPGHGSRSSSTSQKRARRRTQSKSRSKSRNTSQPRGVQKNVHTPQPLSKKALKKNHKVLRKIFHSFYVAMPSPQNMGGAIQSPYLRSVVSGA